MNHYLLFSGGFDSTYQLFRIIDTLLSESGKNDELYLLYVDASFLYNKQPRERNGRQDIIDYIYKFEKFESVRNRIHDYKIGVCTNNFPISSSKYAQQFYIWMPALLSVVNAYEDGTIYICDINGDTQFHMCSKEFDDLMYKILEQSCGIHHSGGSNIKINHDLVGLHKRFIIDQLIKHYPKILDHCISCEGAQDICGVCDKCSETFSALCELQLNYEFRLSEIQEDEESRNEYEQNLDIVKQKLYKWYNMKLEFCEKELSSSTEKSEDENNELINLTGKEDNDDE